MEKFLEQLPESVLNKTFLYMSHPCADIIKDASNDLFNGIEKSVLYKSDIKELSLDASEYIRDSIMTNRFSSLYEFHVTNHVCSLERYWFNFNLIPYIREHIEKLDVDGPPA